MHCIKVSSLLRLGSELLNLTEELFSPTSLRSYFAEFISTFIFVFLGVGSAMSAAKLMTSDATSAETGVLAVAVAHAFALVVAMYLAGDISDGHVNPAVTYGLVVGGHVSGLTGICDSYYKAGSQNIGLADVAIEALATFAIVYAVYVARDLRNGSRGIMGPIAVGFIYGANILVTAPLTGGSMNPARSFGPAFVTGDMKKQWVYWVGPLVGGGIAGLVYESLMTTSNGQPPSSISSVG
ncbi:Aquaporin TIP2-1 [Vitis vinifera]|uniref:Aquaporin TIP2-1 n=1 Tax=Vitis vinifera TaxID=29760 RepID=A0A438BWD3_VITVI|nr:Aquaporin TIP2-1 [Vitis vinifera]